jgi:hypothetical protein
MSLYNSLIDIVKQQLFELKYSEFVQKQKSITKLFPKYPERVQAINANGGIRIIHQFPEVWQFKVASGTKKGVSYTVFLRFKNIKELLAEYVPNKQLWLKSGDGINYNLLAPEIFDKVDIEMGCSCPATLYWGKDFIRTQNKAQWGDGETRPPDIRNPNRYGIACKHGGDVLERLPFYTSTFASFLKSFYSGEVNELLKKVLEREEEVAAHEVEGGG